MKTNPTMNHPIHQLSALIGVICGLTFLPLTVFADNKVVTSSLTESGTSYNDSDPTLPALSVTGNGVVYDGTGITLSTITASPDTTNAIGKGAYINNGATLLLTGGSISTASTYGYGVLLTNASHGTLNNVTIKTQGNGGYGVHADAASTLLLTGGSINIFGPYARGVNLAGNNSGTLNDVSITTQGVNGHGLYTYTSTVTLNGGNISTTGSNGNGIYLDRSSSTLNGVNIVTQGTSGNGAYLYGPNTVTLTDSDILTSGSGAYALKTAGGGTATVNLNGSTLNGTGDSGGIYATTVNNVLTLTGSNGSSITGNVVVDSGATINLTLSGSDTKLIGNVIKDAVSTVTLNISGGASFVGSGTVTSLTLGDDAILAFDGGLFVTGGTITISDDVIVDFSSLTETGTYTVLDWSGATESSPVTADQFNIAGTGVEGTFAVQNGQLTFTANAVPEPSTYFLIGTGLGFLLLTARCRRQARTDA
jgi:hypothetical protein